MKVAMINLSMPAYFITGLKRLEKLNRRRTILP